MQVFILSSGNGYEGYEIEGVYTTEPQARKEAERRLKVEGECWRIDTWEVDGECKSVDFIGDEDEED